uniref:Tripartite motif-containing protein 16-like n=1 Tax=Erpetoichthys calabaricus TaxID=27687 RepID=A0A8C4TPB6_ERPCA
MNEFLLSFDSRQRSSLGISVHYGSCSSFSLRGSLFLLGVSGRPEEARHYPCGHNYCLDCINDYWDQSDSVGVYLCPQCRRSFNVRPELNRNTILTEIIEKLKAAGSDVALSQSYAGPEDVPCDVCPGRKRRAVKTCLTCMASYCESHLQPHREFEALKKHKLVEPNGNLEEKICEKHLRALEVFCRTDGTCVCLLCVATEHKSHDTVTPEEERAGRQSQLDKEKKGLRKRIQETEKRLEEMKESVVKIQVSWSSLTVLVILRV